MKSYTKKEMKKILQRDLTIPCQVEERMEKAYCMMGAGRRRTVHRKSLKRLALTAAAMTMLAATSLGVLAASGFFTKQVTEEKEKLSYKFDVNYDLTSYEVKVTPGYLPEGYTESEEGKYDRDGQQKNGISICGVNAAWLASQPEVLDVENLKELEKTTLDGMEAHVLTLDWDSERTAYAFDKRIYLFNPEEGYVVVVYGGNDLSLDELKKTADHLKVEVDTSQPVAYEEQAEKDRAAQEEEKAWEEKMARRKQGADPEQVASIGEAFESPDGARVSVISAKLSDSLGEYQNQKENFFDYEGEIAWWVEGDGSLKPYERLTLDWESGQEKAREEIGQKILEVTCQAVNPTDQTIDFWAGGGKLTSMSKRADGSYAYPDTYTEPLDLDHGLVQSERYPVYFSAPQNTGENRNHFFFRELKPGESMEYTLLYFVDEDGTGSMYLNYNTSDDPAEDFFVNISQ